MIASYGGNTAMSLNNLKKTVEAHLKKELDIFEIILKMKEEDVGIFLKWYLNHPYVKGIKEVLEILRAGKTASYRGKSQ